jgi:hypothetical protein
VAADDGESFSVKGVVEVADELGLEVGELPARRSVEILQPNFVDIALTYGIDDAFAISAESDRTDGEAEAARRGAGARCCRIPIAEFCFSRTT